MLPHAAAVADEDAKMPVVNSTEGADATVLIDRDQRASVFAASATDGGAGVSL